MHGERRARVRHKKRGSTYTIIGYGELQSSGAIEEGAELVAYICEQDGRIWFRPHSEFYDGRFEPIDPSDGEQK